MGYTVLPNGCIQLGEWVITSMNYDYTKLYIGLIVDGHSLKLSLPSIYFTSPYSTLEIYEYTTYQDFICVLGLLNNVKYTSSRNKRDIWEAFARGILVGVSEEYLEELLNEG